MAFSLFWCRDLQGYQDPLQLFYTTFVMPPILLGAVRALLGVTDNTNTLTIVAGVISELISGSALTLYRPNFNRLNETSSRLCETWKIFAAFKPSKDLSEEERGAATLSLITVLSGASIERVKKAEMPELDDITPRYRRGAAPAFWVVVVTVRAATTGRGVYG